MRPFINLKAAYTIDGGLLTLPEVKRAMEDASYESVNLDELMAQVGQRLGKLFGAEFGIVSSGGAASSDACDRRLRGGRQYGIDAVPAARGCGRAEE